MTVSGQDTLDFSDASAGVNVDLSRDRGRLQHIGGGNNTLALVGDIKELIGSEYDDVLIGNNLGNILRSLGGDDVLIAGVAPTFWSARTAMSRRPPAGAATS